MTKTMLILFWVFWLLDVLAALFGYREFITGVFGRNAVPAGRYIGIWMVLFTIILTVIGISLYFKNHDRPTFAIIVAAVPLALALPYALFFGALMMGGKNNWR